MRNPSGFATTPRIAPPAWARFRHLADCRRSNRRGHFPHAGGDGQVAGIALLAPGGLAVHGSHGVERRYMLRALAARFPEAGGGYVYLREAYGRRVAFLYGWQALLIMDPGLTAALAVGLAGYAGAIVPLSDLEKQILAIVVVWSLAVTNMVGARPGAGVMRWLTYAKLGLLALIIFWGIGRGLGDWSRLLPFVEQRPGSKPLIEGLAGGLVGAFFAFAGWWDLGKLAGEIREPRHTLPRALILGVAVVTVVYIAVSMTFLYLVPLEEVTTCETFATQAGEALFGPAGGGVFAGIVIVAVLGSLASFILAAPRVYFAMARDNLFFPAMAQLHPRFGTPVRAIALQAILACVLILTGTFDEILAFFIFVVVVFLALTVAGIYILRRRDPLAFAGRLPGYPFTPAFFLAAMLVVLALLGAGDPLRALAGVGAVALGLPVYYLLYRRVTSQKDQPRRRVRGPRDQHP